jgi:hypothetical protein
MGSGTAGSGAAGSGTAGSGTSSSGTAGSGSADSGSLQGIAGAGANDPAYQTAYRDCMKKRGF